MKSSSEMLKNMQHLEEVCNVTLVSQDNERIRAHKVVLASVSIPSGTCFRLMTRMHITNLSIYERSIGVKWGIYGERKKTVKISWRSRFFNLNQLTRTRGQSCRDWNCYKQHRMICKYSNSKSSCVRWMESMFFFS